jgi:imidazole glycerol-phosphate synthase subunit HisH
MITIINYGLGNVSAFVTVYKKLNIPVAIATKASHVEEATKLILPGVGAFDQAMQRLDASGMRPVLDQMVLHHKIPILGVCVGMQILGHSSEEGKLPGLGWIDAESKRFDFSASEHAVEVPHMGWNDVKAIKDNDLLRELHNDSRFYFLHSYYVRCKSDDCVIGLTDYGGEFACAVNHRNIYGVQFHPEKSHSWGMQLLKNFAELAS